MDIHDTPNVFVVETYDCGPYLIAASLQFSEIYFIIWPKEILFIWRLPIKATSSVITSALKQLSPGPDRISMRSSFDKSATCSSLASLSELSFTTQLAQS